MEAHSQNNLVHVLIYGNCQTGAVSKTLMFPANEYNVISIECFSTNYDKTTFTNIIKQSSIIITQPISDGYREKDYLSTAYIINNSSKDCKIIIMDICYFDFYYFDLKYKNFNGEVLHQPFDYHYNQMIECYKQNLSEEHYVNEYVNNIHLKTRNDLETMAENSLNELKKRYENSVSNYASDKTFVISIHDFIKDNYKDKLLFYSMNHPTKYVIQFISLSIVSYLQLPIPINYEIDCLDHLRCMLYKSVQNAVNFDINDHIPLHGNITNDLETARFYYATYKNIGL